MVAKCEHDLEAQIAEWRAYVQGRRTIDAADGDELEGHLRDQVAALVGVGLQTDEAFLIAVKRLGNLDALAREFARALGSPMEAIGSGAG